MLKSDKIIPIVASSRPKCGDCLHFARIAKFEKPCNQLGTKHYAEAPTCYDVDPFVLNKINPDTFNQLLLLLRDFGLKQRRTFIQMMRSMNSLEKNYKVELGQPVYFKVGPNDYLSNYFRGFVVGGSSSGDPQVYVTSDLGAKQRASPAMLTLLPSSVMKVSAWKKKRAQLIKDKKLKDPNPIYSSHVDKKDLTSDYTPPTLESAPSEWFDKLSTGKMKASKSLKRDKDGTLSFKMRS